MVDGGRRGRRGGPCGAAPRRRAGDSTAAGTKCRGRASPARHARMRSILASPPASDAPRPFSLPAACARVSPAAAPRRRGAARAGGAPAPRPPRRRRCRRPRCSSRPSSSRPRRARRGAPRRGPRRRRARRCPRRRSKFAPFGAGGGAIFVRADSIDGDGRASRRGVAARSSCARRNETVLADWLRYDCRPTRSGARATCCCAAAPTGSPAPRCGSAATTTPAPSRRRASTSPRTAGAATPPRSASSAPDQYEVQRGTLHDVRGAARGLVHPDGRRSRSTSARMVGTAPQRDGALPRHADRLCAVARVPAVRTSARAGSSRRRSARASVRGFDASLPYYLNLAPNYDATLTPRVMTKRGVQLGAQFRYLSAERAGRRRSRGPAQRPRHRHQPVRCCRGSTTRTSTRLLPGLVGYVNLNKVSDDTYFSDLSDRVSFTSLTTLPREGGIVYTNGPVAAARRGAELPDAAGPDGAAGGAAVQPGAADPRRAAGHRLERAHLRRRRRVRGLPPADADHRPARLRLADRRLVAAGRRVVVHRRATGAHLRQYNLNEVRPDVPSSQSYAIPIMSVDGSLVFERDWNDRRARRRADARAAGVLRLRALPEPERRAGVRHGARRLQLRPAVQRQPLPRQRPDRRRQPAHARAVVAASSTRRRASSGCASRSASASTSRTSASC